jgi:tetratricopeptide (TPR) repeat protein/transcriptional regulator with XRE-family HTH domain
MSTSAFGVMLCQRRRIAGLTQEELSLRSGLSVRAISNLERGRSRPYRRTAESLAHALALHAGAREDFLAVARATRMLDTENSLSGKVPTQFPDGDDVAIAMPVPRQLPARFGHFAGREPELNALSRALAATGAAGAVPILAIVGAPGIGKTTLAFHWAHQVASQFPDGQLFVNLRGFDPSGVAATPAQAIRGFLDALGVPAERIPADPQDQEALYRTVLAGKRILIVADNVSSAADVRPLLPGTSGSVVLVTSRDRLMGLAVADGAFILPLELLSDSEAYALLARRLGAERVDAEHEATRDLIRISARLPLALGIAAAFAAAEPDRPLASLVSNLSRAASPLEALDTGDPMTTVTAVISWSYQHLSPRLAYVFRLLGVHPGPEVSVAAAASLSELQADQTRAALRGLADANLLSEQVPGRYICHDLLRTFAAAQTDSDDRHNAMRRLLDHYLHTAFAADRAINPARDPIRLDPPVPGVRPERIGDHSDAMTWFEIEHKVLLMAVFLAADNGFVSHAWQLPWTLVDFFERRGYWSDWLETQRIAVAAARNHGDTTALAHASRGLGYACARMGLDDDAHRYLAEALSPFRQLGDLIGEARTHQDISWLLDRQGQQAKALHHDEIALRLYQEAGHLAGQANAFNAIGWLNAALGKYRTTVQFCRRALELQRELGNLRGQAAALDSLGYAHVHLGEHSKAVGCYLQSLRLFREVADRPNEADVLVHLGDAHEGAGDITEAHDAWQLAFVILSNLRDPNAEDVRVKLTRSGAVVPSQLLLRLSKDARPMGPSDLLSSARQAGPGCPDRARRARGAPSSASLGSCPLAAASPAYRRGGQACGGGGRAYVRHFDGDNRCDGLTGARGAVAGSRRRRMLGCATPDDVGAFCRLRIWPG